MSFAFYELRIAVFAKKIFSALVLSFFVSPLWAAQCPVDQLKADYQIQIQRAGAPGKTRQSHFSLWREGHQVAHHFDHDNITEVWYLQKNNRAQMTRYFERYQRGIEYEAGEVKFEHGLDWLSKYALLPSTVLKTLKKTGSQAGKTSCDDVEFYTGTVYGEQVTLSWLPSLQLIKEMKVERNGNSKRWLLLSKSDDAKIIAAQFKRWGDYDTTDYADVGDEESDPFLSKMIHQGFVAEGGEAFDGQQGYAGHHH